MADTDNSKILNRLKNTFAVLNNINRIKIILLCSEKEMNVTELSKKLKLNYSVTSEYVSMLEKAGLIRKIRNKNKTVNVESLIEINENGEVRKI